MININVVNVLTIVIISVLGYAATKMALKAVGYTPAWL